MVCSLGKPLPPVQWEGKEYGLFLLHGVAGERFAARNSGATAIVEAVGDHGCEYMTGGRVIILGTIGRNFAAAMSGGIAYLFNQGNNFTSLINNATVDLDEIDAKDVEYLFKQISSFVAITGSELGKRMIDNWNYEKTNVIKVFPREYKRVLQEQKEEEKRQAEIAKSTQEASLLSVDGAHTRTQTLSMDMQIAPTLKAKKRESQRKKSILVDNRRRSFSKSLRPQDMAGFENEKYLQQEIDFEEEDETKSDIEEHSEEEEFQMNKKMPTDIESLGIPAHLQKKDCDAKERLGDSDEVYGFEANIHKQTARCMNCGVPFCQGHSGCPLGNIIPKWNDYGFKKNLRQALKQLLQINNFPEFTGRVCPASCEGACCLGIGSPAVTIKSIECAIIDYAFMQGWMKPNKPNFNTGKRIAIIGSGPSGLAAAAQLVKVGHNICVYERNNRCGGLLRYGSPTTNIEDAVIDRRISLLKQEGVRFLTNTEIGKHVPAEFLLKDNDAVIVCTGSTTVSEWTFKARNVEGICLATEYMEKIRKCRLKDEIALEGLDPAGKNVIVLGGGNIATHCIVTSKMLGCKFVGDLKILPRPNEGRQPKLSDWPLIFRTKIGNKEKNVTIKGLLTTTNSAGVKVLIGLEIVEVESEKNENGAWKLVEKANTLRLDVDLLILAEGFVGPEKTVIEQLNLKTDPRSNILTPKDKYDSAVAKVFAAGDCRRGQSLVVWAIHEGRQAACQVDEYLMGKTIRAGPGGIVTSNIVHKQAI